MSSTRPSSSAPVPPVFRLTERQHAENTQFPSVHMLSDHARILLCAIPVNGCTTVKNWFIAYHRPDLLPARPLSAHYVCNVHLTLNRFAPEVVDGLFARLFSFAFVREPFGRYVSTFCKKFCRAAPNDLFRPSREVIECAARRQGIDTTHDSVNQLRVVDRFVEVPFCSRVDYDRGISFREFVDYLCECPSNQMLESHWRPQNMFLEGRRWDLIAPMETQNAVLDRISELLGRPDLVTKHSNATPYTAVPPDIGVHAADIPSGECFRRKIVPTRQSLDDPELVGRLRARFPAEFELYEQVSAAPLKLPDAL